MNAPRVPFREIMQPNLRPYLLAPDEDANLVGMRLYGAGPFHRELKSATAIRKKSHFVIKRGDVIYNKLFAWKGTFGIVPSELDGMFVSDKFPTYKLDTTRVSEKYLAWFFRHPAVWEQARAKSTGSAALSKLTLNPPRFLELEIPLPPLLQQQDVAAHLDELEAKIGAASSLRDQSAKAMVAFVASVHSALSHAEPEPLSNFLELVEDAVPVKLGVPYPQAGVRGFGGGLFPKAPVHGGETTYRAFNRLYSGALVMSQVKGWEGAVAMTPVDLEGYFVSPEYRTFRCKADRCLPAYLAALVPTEFFWGQLKNATRGVGARRERTRPEQFLQLKFSMPSVPDQQRAVAMFAQVNAMRQMQIQTAEEINALIPAILDQVFKGEL